MAEKPVKMEAKGEPKMGARKPPRQMAAKACERCRRRKIKCDEFFPCGQCTRMRVVCKIEDPAEKRREQQQTAMEDRIKRLEALLIATYSNPNNHLEMAGLDQDLIPVLGASPQAQSPAGKLEPPRLTLQTPSSPDFGTSEPNELLSAAGDYSFGLPYWNSPESLTPSAPASASDYFPNNVPLWSTTVTRGGSTESTPQANSPRPNHTRQSSISTSDASQDSLAIHDRIRLSVDTSGSTLGIPQIAVTSWDHSRPQSPVGGFSPALSPVNMEQDAPMYYPPELSIGSWSGLSSPPIMASGFSFDDHLSITNQSLPSHSRRSSVNSLNPEYEPYSEPKRRRAASDLFPVPQQFVYPDSSSAESLFFPPQPPQQHRPATPNLHPLGQSPRPRQDSLPPHPPDDIYSRTFLEIIYPLFPLLSPQNLQTQLLSQSHHTQITPSIAQTQSLLTRAISSYILSLRSSQPTIPAQNYFAYGLQSHGSGRWDSLPGIQSGILLAIFILVSGCQGPNLYILNANIVASCLDLGLHNGGNLVPGSLDANTLFAAYVLDRTVSLVRNKPSLMKDSDLDQAALSLVKNQLRDRVEKREVRRCAEGGRLWDWWVVFEEGVRGSGSMEVMAQQMESGFGF